MYLVRAPLLLIYISALFATGLAPLVRIIERQRVMAISKRRLPRAAAILLIYATVLGSDRRPGRRRDSADGGAGAAIRKALPDGIDQAQQRLARWGLISPGASFKDLLQQAPAGGGDAVAVVLGALWGFVGGFSAWSASCC